MPTPISPDGRDRKNWECVEPTSLEQSELDRENVSEAPACAVGEVPTASARMPLRKKAALAFDAIKKLFGYAEGMRSAKSVK